MAQRKTASRASRGLGIGAATLGFLCVADAAERDWDALITDLQVLYGDPAAPAWTDLAPVLRESPVLLLGYTEGFAEFTEDEDD